jgi:hypothetical protein
MLAINLVSRQSKKELKGRAIYAYVKKICLTLAFFSLLIGAIVAISYYALNDLSESIFQVSLKKNAVKTDVSPGDNNITGQINLIGQIQNDYIPWSITIEELASFINDDVRIGKLTFDKSTKRFSLSGHAGKRESLLELKDRLDNSKYFKNIDFPVKNLLEKNNIDFELKGDINMENVKKILDPVQK